MTEKPQSSSATAPPDAAPVVDPSPTAAPIAVDRRSLEELMRAHPAAASDEETLALKPNTAAEATSGPDAQISQTAYVEMTKPDGTTCLVPLSNVPYYEGKGYTAGAEQDIPDLPAYWAEKAGATPAAPALVPPPEQPAESP
jgi:hypothetical protein